MPTSHSEDHNTAFGGQKEEPEDDPEQLVCIGSDRGAGVQSGVRRERHGNQTPVRRGKKLSTKQYAAITNLNLVDIITQSFSALEDCHNLCLFKQKIV